MKCRYITIMIIVSLLLCSCQTNPTRHAVISKNDGSFDVRSIESSDSYVAEPQPIICSDKFTSKDNSVEFEMNIDTILPNGTMPVVEVTPHYINEVEAQKIAEAIFGNSLFCDLDQTLSKDEIMQCLTRWTPWANTDAMRDLYPSSDEITIEWRVNQLKECIENFTRVYEEAQTNNPQNVCQWQFHKDSYYTGIPDENIENENDSIQATTNFNGIPYKLSIFVRNKDDYKLNCVFAYPREFIILDQAIYRAAQCRSSRPSELQIEEIQKLAETILEQIDIGEWKIDECYVNSTAIGEYVICVNAVPVLQGVSALRLPQLSNLKSENAYSSNYYLSNVSFQFSPDGDLLFFEFQSPIDVSSVINENVVVLDTTEILERLKEALSLSDIYAYDYDSIVDLCKESEINIGCKVLINQIEQGLIRVKKPNTDDFYYYVPGYLFGGNIELFDKTSGEVFSYFEDMNLLALNAVDGSIVHMNDFT